VAAAPRSVGEIPGFIDMLLAACENRMVHDKLEALLSMPDPRRRAIVHAWVNDLLIAQAPRDFIAAIACLQDDAVAEKAYQAIFDCARRKGHGARMP
jgi:hypothetical protein